MDTNKVISDMAHGQWILNSAKVMPLGLLIENNRWSYYKYKALPGHSRPGNAPKGFSHPDTTGGADFAEINRQTKSKLDAKFEVINPDWTDEDAWNSLVQPIIDALKWNKKDVTAYYSRITDTGKLTTVDIARGGILVWEDYPSDMADVGTNKEIKRIGKIRKDEQGKTDAYVSEYLSEQGKKGGSAKTPAKKKSSAENGKKGGRPRKKKEE